MRPPETADENSNFVHVGDAESLMYCPLKFLRQTKEDAYCEGVSCMAWRTSRTIEDGAEDTEGYCGLAGHPRRIS